MQYAETLLLPTTDAYRPWEERWIHMPDTVPRYMRAAKWNLADGKKRIKGTIEWRREFKPDLITPDEVKIESETGKMCAFTPAADWLCVLTRFLRFLPS